MAECANFHGEGSHCTGFNFNNAPSSDYRGCYFLAANAPCSSLSATNEALVYGYTPVIATGSPT